LLRASAAGWIFAKGKEMNNASEAINVVDFGDLTPQTNALLQQGVVAYRTDRAHANALFRQALEQAPQELPVYFCLYKIHAYRGDLDEALAMARAGLAEAARQSDLPADWRQWRKTDISARNPTENPMRFALYTLKALAFVPDRLPRRRYAVA
jgi:hypothetical protein